MATNAGTIGIGVTLDAGDIMGDLTREVEKAMKGVFSSVSVNIADINKVLHSIDTKSMADQMAADNRKMESAMKAATSATNALGDASAATGKKEKAAAGDADSAARANRNLDDSAKGAASSTDKLGGAVSKAGGFLKGYGGLIAGVAGLGGIGTVLTKGLDRLTAIDNAQAKLSGLGHSAEAVDQIMQNAMASVKGTAYGLGDAASVAASAVAAGIAPGQDLERTLKVIGDAASIAGTDLGSMGAIFNKVAASNKIQGDVIDQLNEAGIPVVQLLGKELGKTSEEVVKLASDGQINFASFQSAMEKGMGGAALKAGNTFKGAVDNAGAALGRLGATILDAPFKAAPGIIGNVTDGIDKLNTKLKGALEVLTTGAFGDAWKKAFPDLNYDNSPMGRFLADTWAGFADAKDMAALFFGTISGAGADVDLAPDLMNKIIEAGAMFSDWGSRVGDIFDQLSTAATDLVGPIGTIIGTLGEASAAIGFSTWDMFLSLLEVLTPIIVNTLVPAVETLARLMDENQAAVTAMVGAFTAYKAAALTYTGVMKGMAIAQAAWTAATKASDVAMKLLDKTMKLSTFGVIVTAITLVVSALTYFFTQTETGKAIFASFLDVVSSVWDGITSAVGAAWEFLVGVFDGIKSVIGSVISFVVDNWQLIVPAIFGPLGLVVTLVITFWDQIKGAFVAAFDAITAALTFLYEEVIKPIWNAIAATIAFVWDNVIMPYFKVWETVVMGIIVPILMFLWNQVVVPVFNAIGNVIKTVWDTVISVVFAAMKIGLQALGDFFGWIWNNIIKPAWDGLAFGISWTWENVIRPAWDALKGALGAVGDFFGWIWNSIIKPAWDGLGAGISWVWEHVIRPAWDAMKGALEGVGNFFSATVNGIQDVWNKLRNILAVPINFMINTVYNNGIRKAWNKVAEFIPGLVTAPEISPIPEHATGGRIVGPGSGTSDDVLMWGSNGEHMVTAQEVIRAGGHAALYTIRDMIMRGIPFSWDNGRVISQLGQNNVQSYGNAVETTGYGRVDPQGLFDQFLPRYATGGAIQGPPSGVEPWMYQLLAGHEFAKSQHGKPYQWAGPRFVGDSFDCSGFMGSIAAAILGGNVWQRYWATGSFGRGQGSGGPQGFVPGVDNGFTIGVTDDPGGPGGGHTAGTLGALPALGIMRPVNVESGGSIGDVHYGGGPDPRSFLGQYHLPIGANGFFEPGVGGGFAGPSPDEQRSWLARKAMDVLTFITDPIKGMFAEKVGTPPPEWLAIPPKFLDAGIDAVGGGIDTAIDGLGDLLSSAWAGAQSKVGDILGALNPFDSGGIANGTGFMPKNVIAPERVLSPEQTRLFDTMVQALTDISRGQFSGAVRQVTGQEEDSPLTKAVLSTRDAVLGTQAPLKNVSAAVTEAGPVITETGEIVAGKIDENTDAVKAGNEDSRTDLAKLIDAWAVENIAGPLQRAMENAISSDEARKLAMGLIDGLGTQVDDALQAAGDAIVKGVVDVVTGTVETFVTSAIDAAFGKNDGPFEQWWMNAWAKAVDADIQTRELLTSMAKEVRAFRGDLAANYAVMGEIMSDTASLMDRTGTSKEISKQVQIDAMNEMMRATIQFLIQKILFPALAGLLTALITAGLTAVGTAIGGPIGAAIGAGIGAAISGVLTGILGNAMGGVFDDGGLAHGVGMMPKNTIRPERVLSPRQTNAFERLVDVLDKGGLDRRSVHAPIYVQGATAPQAISDRLVGGLN